MKITLRLFAQFLSCLPSRKGERESVITLPNGSTVGYLIEKVGLPAEIPKIILINGAHKNLKDQLYDKDIVSIFPPLGGG